MDLYIYFFIFLLRIYYLIGIRVGIVRVELRFFQVLSIDNFILYFFFYGVYVKDNFK